MSVISRSLIALLLYSVVSTAQGQIILGGITGMEDCIERCLPVVKRDGLGNNPGPECANFCRCSLSLEGMTKPAPPRSNEEFWKKVDEKAHMCALDIWPNVKVPPEIRDKHEKQRAEKQREEDAQKAAEKSAAEAKTADGSAKLDGHEIRTIHVVDWKWSRASQELRQMMEKVSKDGQKVIRCTYGPAQFPSGTVGFYSFVFWHDRLPPSIDELRKNDPQGALNQLGIEAMKQCPSSEAAAMEVQTASMNAFPSSNTEALRPKATIPTRPSIQRPGQSSSAKSDEAIKRAADRKLAMQQRRCEQFATRLQKARERASSDASGRLARRLASEELKYADQCG